MKIKYKALLMKKLAIGNKENLVTLALEKKRHKPDTSSTKI